MDPIPCVSTTTQGKPLDLAAWSRRSAAREKNASYDRATGQVVEGRIGVTFDGGGRGVEAPQPARRSSSPARITLSHPSPKGGLEKVLFRDVLGQYTSYVSGTNDRIFNVRYRREHQRLRGQQRRKFQLFQCCGPHHQGGRVQDRHRS